MKLRIFSTFAGYGTDHFALKQLGIPYENVGFSEIDEYATQCFKQNHGGENYGDITQIDWKNVPDFDLLTGGFPCTDVSVAGKQDLSKGRTILGYELVKALIIKQPKYFLFENVKGLMSKKFNEFREELIKQWTDAGYNIYYKVLNTKDYGVPQNRERVWFVGFRKDIDKGNFKFPEKEELKIFIKDILEPSVDDKYFLSEDAVKRLEKRCNIGKDGIMGCLTSTIYKVNWNTPLIKTRSSYVQYDFGNSSQQDRIYNIDCISPTIIQNIPKILWEEKIRRLTPKECFRLQGFLNDEVDISNLSDTQCYKLAGNGQSVNVVMKIFKEMFK